MKYKYVFVVLVYRNIEVLRDFFVSLKVSDYRVIVVNSFYDDESLNECRDVAFTNKADFIPIENKGFGYGNNVGTKYAIEHYEYDYLILSNSDIHINSISYLDSPINEAAVIAPHTHLLNNRVQNPNIPWYMPWLIPLHHLAYKWDSRMVLHLPHILTRICREIFFVYNRICKKDKYKIYSCHGSFIVFSATAVERLFPFFNEEMFLYNEELYLAERCRMKHIPIYYCPQIDVLHLEGASTSKGSGYQWNKQSFNVLYSWLKDNEV